jgi:hypothetical protein
VQVTEDTTLDITLEPGFLLSGRVIDREGKGIFPTIIVAQEPGMEWREYIPAVAEGEADGSYHVWLMGGTYDLLFLDVAEGESIGVGRKLMNVEMRTDRTLDIVLPSLESARRLSGTVTDNEGRSIADLLIEAYDPATGNYAIAATERDGTYSMKLPPGTYDLTVSPPNGSELPKGEVKGVQIVGDTVKNFIVGAEIITAVEGEDVHGLPRTFALFQSYPNPFNAQTNISYELPKACRVCLMVYNALGQKVEMLVDQHQGPGWYAVLWDGSRYADGVYLYHLEAGNFVETKRMVVVK